MAQLDAAYEYVLRNINMGSEINGLYRTDIYELPTDCIREMICNRDSENYQAMQRTWTGRAGADGNCRELSHQFIPVT